MWKLIPFLFFGLNPICICPSYIDPFVYKQIQNYRYKRHFRIQWKLFFLFFLVPCAGARLYSNRRVPTLLVRYFNLFHPSLIKCRCIQIDTHLHILETFQNKVEADSFFCFLVPCSGRVNPRYLYVYAQAA